MSGFNFVKKLEQLDLILYYSESGIIIKRQWGMVSADYFYVFIPKRKMGGWFPRPSCILENPLKASVKDIFTCWEYSSSSTKPFHLETLWKYHKWNFKTWIDWLLLCDCRKRKERNAGKNGIAKHFWSIMWTLCGTIFFADVLYVCVWTYAYVYKNTCNCKCNWPGPHLWLVHIKLNLKKIKINWIRNNLHLKLSLMVFKSHFISAF